LKVILNCGNAIKILTKIHSNLVEEWEIKSNRGGSYGSLISLNQREVTKVVVMAEISLNQREVVAMAARRNFILLGDKKNQKSKKSFIHSIIMIRFDVPLGSL
jgi:hypothetical protein